MTSCEGGASSVTSFPVSSSVEEAATTQVEVTCQPLVQVKYATFPLSFCRFQV